MTMKLSPSSIQSWVSAINSLVMLGVPLVQLIGLIRQNLSAEDANAVLLQIKAGWNAAKAENDARIAELEAQIRTTNGG